MRLSQTGDVWWKSAVFYCADVETFQDSNGDGIGDLRGMTEPELVQLGRAVHHARFLQPRDPS